VLEKALGNLPLKLNDLKIGIFDSGLSNLGAVEKWLLSKFDTVSIISETDQLNTYNLVVMPGIGSFDALIDFLVRSNRFNELKDFIEAGGKYLGICLGFQILFTSSEEGKRNGLGIFKDKIRKLDRFKKIRMPHVGFNNTTFNNDKNTDKSYYFVHNYGLIDEVKSNPSIEKLGYTDHDGQRIIAFIETKNIMAMQFHPEKSSLSGVSVLNTIEQWLSNA